VIFVFVVRVYERKDEAAFARGSARLAFGRPPKMPPLLAAEERVRVRQEGIWV